MGVSRMVCPPASQQPLQPQVTPLPDDLDELSCNGCLARAVVGERQLQPGGGGDTERSGSMRREGLHLPSCVGLPLSAGFAWKNIHASQHAASRGRDNSRKVRQAMAGPSASIIHARQGLPLGCPGWPASSPTCCQQNVELHAQHKDTLPPTFQAPSPTSQPTKPPPPLTLPSISPAFLVEFSIALMRDDCSEQLFSSIALYSVCGSKTQRAKGVSAAHNPRMACAPQTRLASAAHRGQLELCQVHEQLGAVGALQLVRVDGGARLSRPLQRLREPKELSMD